MTVHVNKTSDFFIKEWFYQIFDYFVVNLVRGYINSSKDKNKKCHILIIIFLVINLNIGMDQINCFVV